MRLCEVKTIFEGNLVLLYKIYTVIIGLDKHASVNIVWLIPVILAEYFEIWIIELNLNGYCLNCSESQSSAPGRTNLYGHQYYKN
jgi:hypothetical protein